MLVSALTKAHLWVQGILTTVHASVQGILKKTLARISIWQSWGNIHAQVVSYPCSGKHGDVNVYQGTSANDYLKLFSMNVTNTFFADSIFDLDLSLSDCIAGYYVTLAEIKDFEARRWNKF